MLKIKSLFLMTILSAGVLLGASTAFAACDCSSTKACDCAECNCSGCND